MNNKVPEGLQSDEDEYPTQMGRLCDDFKKAFEARNWAVNYLCKIYAGYYPEFKAIKENLKNEFYPNVSEEILSIKRTQIENVWGHASFLIYILFGKIENMFSYLPLNYISEEIEKISSYYTKNLLDFICFIRYIGNPKNPLNKYKTNNNVIKDLIKELEKIN